MATSPDITSALVTYGLMSDANREKLDAWFNDLFDEIGLGGGGQLLSSSVAGRSFTFAPSNVTIQDMFDAVDRAIRILNGRGRRTAIKRF